MKYGMYLYKTTAVSKDAMYVSIINRMLTSKYLYSSENYSADDGMLSFDAESIKNEILTELTVNNHSLCKAQVHYSPRNKIEYIYVVTSYEKAKSVLTVLNSIAMKHELVLYDAEMNRNFYISDLYYKNRVVMRSRAKAIKKLIYETQTPFWSLKKLENDDENEYASSSYALTVTKDARSFKERTADFYQMLKSNLADGERLITKNKCFTVCGDGYEITYCFEGYKKSADKIGYVKNGIICTELIKRMPCDLAIKQCYSFDERERENVYDRMKFRDWREKHPNPAERFVASVNLSKQLKKEKFDISVGGIGEYGSEILFHVINYPYSKRDSREISVLKIEEESASFILPIIETVYPYIYSRYYLSENHIPLEMMRDILSKIKEAKEMILKDTYNEKIASLSLKFNLYILAKEAEDKSQGIFDSEDTHAIQNDRMMFIYNHRYEIAHLYDIFVSWVEDQIEYCGCGDDIMFNIQGP